MNKMTWDWNFCIEILPELVRAVTVTLEATLAGSVLAITLGLPLALARRSEVWIFSSTSAAFVEFVRSTPLLVQIYFIYYVLPDFGLKLSPFLTGVIALGLHFSSYMSEVYRAGINGIPSGQWEAAVALNLSPFRTYKDIIIPQAIPPVIPATGNYVIGMFKETPQLSAITLIELLQRAKIIGSENFRYLEPLTLVGIIFLLLSLLAAFFIKTIEKKLPKEGIKLQ